MTDTRRTENLPALFDAEAPMFTVTVAARLADMHPQTLRGYDRQGLVVPRRSSGRGRRYSLRDIQRLRHIQQLSQREGINLEGIRRILELEAQLEAANEQAARLVTLLEEARATAPSRLFTAGSAGQVALGRHAVRTARLPALPSGR
ncbi:heat shock protein transcriptional repressor HspR [Nigerium massiliense]|uniref:heat shock protein transcriptional repressor HspR n=1 Tax=Nigerium massiliense TaxID=1522317 RepID=UPI00058E7F84|nr:MerR family transcriptional regulator [Nigerium massiliense]